MEERFSQRILRALLIAIPGFLFGMCACGSILSGTRDAAAAYCLSTLFIGVVSLVIGWLLSSLVRKQRFVRVPRPEYIDDDDDFEVEKPKRG